MEPPSLISNGSGRWLGSKRQHVLSTCNVLIGVTNWAHAIETGRARKRKQLISQLREHSASSLSYSS